MLGKEDLEAIEIHLKQMTQGCKLSGKTGHPKLELPYFVEVVRGEPIARFKYEVDAIAYRCYEGDVKNLLGERDRMKRISLLALGLLHTGDVEKAKYYLEILAEGTKAD
jgi:hypothetical protein